MAISFHCPSCNRRIGVADTAAGKKAKCPYCQHVSTVPAGDASEKPREEEASPSADEGPSRPESASAGPPPPPPPQGEPPRSPYDSPEHFSDPNAGSSPFQVGTPGKPKPPMPHSPTMTIVVSVLITFFCCQPLGIASVVLAILGYTSYDSGKYEDAANYIRWAMRLNYIAILCGVVLIMSWLGIIALSTVAGV